MIAILIFFVASWYLNLFAQSFFLHRYAAHGMFTMSRGWEKFFFIISGIFQGSSYLSPKAYGIMHREHHAYADTELDPHSPKYSKNLFDMMWKTKRKYCDILYNRRKDLDPKFTKNIPVWDSVDWFFDWWPTRISWGILYTLFYIGFAPSPWWYILLPIQYLMGPFHGVIINWFAHLYGYINFKMENTSRNFLPFDFLMWGESYHNNHHQYPSRANFGVKWWEFDPMYHIPMRLLSVLGIIKIKKVLS